METHHSTAPSVVALFERLADGVYTLAARVVGDRHLGEDVVQETFLIALGKIHTWTGVGSIEGWIYRIAYRQAIAQLRRRREHAIDPADLVERVDPRPGPEHDAVQLELARRIDRAIGSLNSTLRAAFVLRDVEGLSTAEVAAVLSLSESAVKMRLKRARLALRRDLEDML
jgi:RNA polymerase sigma-70 factor (ECF subfamily)